MVDLAIVEGDGAALVHGTGRVLGPERHALRSRREPSLATDVEGLSLTAEDDGDDAGVAGDAAGGLGR